jgi:hypothetical protein
LNDEALTTGFVRRMLKQLPVALDRINAEAALLLAEQGRMDWARFHVAFMRETHPGLDDVDSTAAIVLCPSKRRVDQYLESFESEADKSPQRGADLAIQLLDRCRPMMDLFDLFHGAEAHQRNDLFDKVAETVLEMVVGHQKTTSDNKTFVDLLQKTLQFASGSSLRERILKNIAIGEGNLKFVLLEPLLAQLKCIQDGKQTPEKKLKSFQESILPKVPDFASKVGSESSAYASLMNTLALALREISIDAHNDTKDLKTAEAAIKIAHGLAVDKDLKTRIAGDLEAIQKSTGTATCFFCGSNHGDPKRSIKIPMHKITERMHNGVRYASNTISVPRCGNCYGDQNRHWRLMWWGAVGGSIVGAFIVPWSAAVGACIAALIAGGWLTYLLLRQDSDGRIGCFGIGGTIVAIGYLWQLFAEESIGDNILLNMLGGAIVGAIATLWIAKKLIYKTTPEAIAMKYDLIASLAREGWLPGGRP